MNEIIAGVGILLIVVIFLSIYHIEQYFDTKRKLKADAIYKKRIAILTKEREEALNKEMDIINKTIDVIKDKGYVEARKMFGVEYTKKAQKILAEEESMRYNKMWYE